MQWIGNLAAILTTASFIPQAYKVYKTKAVNDISLWMFLLFTTGVLLWLIYGLIINDLPIILANSFTFIMAAYILWIKLKSRHF